MLKKLLKKREFRLANSKALGVNKHRRSVAQPGSASGLGPEGREFESLHSDHFLKTNHYFGIR